ncbi:hypothetical protein ACFYE2_08030 [Kocuria sp. CPCC 205300]|uniref:hypothetical protein n=1 Tax=Kocuria sabuli TaxID=3071448 RepID=UPI0036DB97DC
MAPLDKGEARAVAVFNTLRGNAPALLVGTAAALLALHPFGDKAWMPNWLSFLGTPVLFYLALTLYLAAVVAFILRKDSVGSLRAKVRTLGDKNEQLSLHLMAVLLEEIRQLLMQLGLDTTNHRISLYRHCDGKFRLLARYSKNPTYQHSGRSMYPDNQGLIGQCWTEGKKHVRNLPADPDKWVERAVVKYKFSVDEARKIRMKSRSMMGVRLDCGHTRAVPTGVIIVESMDPGGMAGEADNLANNQIVGLITRSLQVSIQSLPADGRDAMRKIMSPATGKLADAKVPKSTKLWRRNVT